MALARLPDWPLRGEEDEAAVPDSASEASAGIWRLSLGRGPEREPLVSEREGAANSGPSDCVRPWLGTERGAVVERGGGLISGEPSCFMLPRGGSPPPKKEASTELFSSMGVKMLWDFPFCL